MKRTLLAAVMAAAIATISAGSALGQAPTQPQMPMGPGQGMGGGAMGPGMGQGQPGGPGMMGPGMMGPGMGPGMMGRGSMGPGGQLGGPEERPLISLMLRFRQQLGLSNEQVGKLTALRSGFEKEAIRAGAEIRVVEIELDDLLDQEKVDLGKVEAAIRKEESLRGNLRLSRIKTIEAGKAILTAEQRDKLKKNLEGGSGMGMMGSGMMGPGMMGPGMMGPGGQGQGMMMGPQMMQQMMGGGMGQQATAAPSAPTIDEAKWKRTDSTGPVTVEATLLDPGKASDRIRIQIVLDTHSAELDGYKLESLMTLRTDTGKTVRPNAVESPSGSGHHRKGVLVFPGNDASGPLLAGAKTLELIVRDVGGVKERALRWALP